MLHANLYNFFEILFRQLDIPVLRALLIESIDMQQGRQSFDAIREVLLDFGISSKSYRLSGQELVQLETPLIVQLNIGNKDELAILQTIENDNYVLLLASTNKIRLTVPEFNTAYSGVVLVPFIDEYSGEIIGEKSAILHPSRLLKYTGIGCLALASCLLWVLAFFYAQDTIGILSYLLILKLMGIWITIQIVKVELNQEDEFIQRICRKSNCHKVLHSKAAHPISWLSMGDLGIVYFSASLLILFCSIGFESDGTFYSLLSFFSFVALPYTLFSIYYQKNKVKAWCPFCISVMAIFWLESIGFAVWYVNNTFKLNIVTVWYAFVFYTLCSVVWIIVRKLLIKKEQCRGGQQFINYVKRNTSLFRASLHLERTLPIRNKSMLMPTIGNEESRHVIILAISPSCPMCVKLYRQAVGVVAKFPGLVKISVCMKSTDEISAESRVIEWMMSAYWAKGIEGMTQVYEFWIELQDKDLSFFEEKMILAGFKLNTQAQIMRLQHQEWIDQADIVVTPTLIYNQKIIPYWYLFFDLITIIIRVDHEES